MNSPISMKNGTFNTSKCKGKLQKMGCYTPILPKALAHSPNFQKKNFKISKFQKKMDSLVLSKCQPAVARWPRVNAWTGPDCFFFLIVLISCPPLFAQVVNSYWLAPAHGHPAQTSPKNFKHP
jgi:hypothetical protein